MEESRSLPIAKDLRRRLADAIEAYRRNEITTTEFDKQLGALFKESDENSEAKADDVLNECLLRLTFVHVERDFAGLLERSLIFLRSDISFQTRVAHASWWVQVPARAGALGVALLAALGVFQAIDGGREWLIIAIAASVLTGLALAIIVRNGAYWLWRRMVGGTFDTFRPWFPFRDQEQWDARRAVLTAMQLPMFRPVEGKPEPATMKVCGMPPPTKPTVGWWIGIVLFLPLGLALAVVGMCFLALCIVALCAVGAGSWQATFECAGNA